ncbi:MAG: hypothetical protein H7A35_07220 [Planctomycetales bacterium]|nr:hypothetical protein [bacterium]UNM09843.1 MAG: hypothetical protein H7A35_07220 [Planctomycetales bacterium]
MDGLGFFYGSRILGRSPAFWPLVLITLVLTFSTYDSGKGLRSIFLGTWHGIPVILLILLAMGLTFWLDHYLEKSTREELGQEIEKNEAAFTAAHRPGGWKQYYGIEEQQQPEVLLVPDRLRRQGWRASYGEAGDRLADMAQRYREEQEKLRRQADNLDWVRGRSGDGNGSL